MQDVNTDNIVILKLVETKTNSKYLIQYLDNNAIIILQYHYIYHYYFIIPSVLVFLLPFPKMNTLRHGYVKAFKVKDGNKDKSNKLMSFHIDDEKLLD